MSKLFGKHSCKSCGNALTLFEVVPGEPRRVLDRRRPVNNPGTLWIVNPSRPVESGYCTYCERKRLGLFTLEPISHLIRREKRKTMNPGDSLRLMKHRAVLAEDEIANK